MVNSTPGYGTLLTNNPGNNGYDTATPGNSLLSFISGNPGSFLSVNNTNYTMATVGGYFVYIRGDRSAAVSTSTFHPTATTLRTNGLLNIGTQLPVNLPIGQNVVVGNIYAAPIDFARLTKSGITSFKVWDPKLHGTYNIGGYQTFSATNGYDPIPGGGSYGSRPNSIIESGQAFMANSPGEALYK